MVTGGGRVAGALHLLNAHDAASIRGSAATVADVDEKVGAQRHDGVGGDGLTAPLRFDDESNDEAASLSLMMTMALLGGRRRRC